LEHSGGAESRFQDASLNNSCNDLFNRSKGANVIVLGLILLILGLVIGGLHILFVLGVILLVVGVVLALLGGMGRAVGGRKHWY
jgi:hypothetical protein